MPPEATQEPPTQGHPDEKSAGEHISYWLEKLGCALIPIVEIRPGQVTARIDIVKIPPDVLKQMKKDKKNGVFGPPAPGA